MATRTAFIRMLVIAAGLVVLTLSGRPPATATQPGSIVFVTNRGNQSDIYVMTPAGYRQTLLTSDPAEDTMPAVSPDGTTIAFTSARDGDYEIYVMNADGSGQTNVSNSPSSLDMLPAWSPDGTRILFTTDRDGQAELYTMDPDGSNPANVTNTSTNEASGRYSPDGAQIVFMTDRDAGDYELYVMEADGTNATNVSNNIGSVDLFPDWSPDGAKIAFVSERDGNREVYTMDPDGSNQARLTNTTSDENTPVWSPDSSKIAYDGIFYTAPNVGNGEVFVMDADGSNQTNLTKAPHAEGFPAWSASPLPSGDTDGDGCTDDREAGLDPVSGGQRNPKDVWDYGDMPEGIGGPDYSRDRLIRVNDILAVVDHYFANDAGGTAAVNRYSDPLTPAPFSGYHPAFDRGAVIGPNPWNVAPPDGIITIQDVLYVVKQYFHDCV
jgi:TolB protein